LTLIERTDIVDGQLCVGEKSGFRITSREERTAARKRWAMRVAVRKKNSL